MDSLRHKLRECLDKPAGSLILDDLPSPTLSQEWLSELQISFRDMQSLICYLLRKNQELRLELFIATAHLRDPMKKSSTSSSTVDHSNNTSF